MPTDEERYLFDLNGYLVVRNALTPREVDDLNKAIDRLPTEARGGRSAHAHRGLALPAANGGPPGGAAAGTPGLLEWGPEVRALVGHRSLTPYLAALLGEDFRLDHQYAIFQRDLGGAGVPNPLHNGAVPFHPTCYYLVRDGRIHNGMVVVSVALTDVPPGAGGFCCVPGSHKSNFPLPASLRAMDGPRAILEHVPLGAGDVLLFTEALTHGALPWHGTSERRALLFKYCPGHIQWDSARVPADSYDWTAAQRRILRPPFARDREPTAGGQTAMVRHWLHRRAARLRDDLRRRMGGRTIDHA